jgi:argininosuccinate lyase
MQSVEAGITKEVLDVLGVDNSVKSRTSLGGTAPENVRRAVAEARKRYLE